MTTLTLRSRAAYATWTPGRGEWTITAYDDGTRLPLTVERLDTAEYDPRVVGIVNPALREIRDILAESGLCTSGPWTDGPATPEMAEWRISLT